MFTVSISKGAPGAVKKACASSMVMAGQDTFSDDMCFLTLVLRLDARLTRSNQAFRGDFQISAYQIAADPL